MNHEGSILSEAELLVFEVAAELNALLKFSRVMLETVPNDKLNLLIRSAKAQGIRTAAEGIQRFDQLKFLKQAGCEEGQGMLISKPRPISELVFLIKKGRCW